MTLNQEEIQHRKTDPQWNAIKYKQTIWCSCCHVGYTCDTLTQVSVVLMMAMSNNTYNPRAYA